MHYTACRGIMIAVGLPVTRQPPHRSRRAVFPHRALREYSLPHEDSATDGHQAGFGATDDSWSYQCEVMTQSMIAVPGVTGALTAPIQPLQMQPLQLMEELVQAGVVAVHSVVVVITSELGIQPPKLFLHPQMAILFAPFGCPLERAAKLLSRGAPLKTCLSLAVCTPTKIEAQKVKAGFTAAVATKRYDPRLCRRDCQPELLQAFLQFAVEALRIFLPLEPADKVICESNQERLAATTPPDHFLEPQIERV